MNGLVDAGVWPDDTAEWVTVSEPSLIVSRKGIVTVRLEEL